MAEAARRCDFPPIETARLVLRVLTLEDVPAVYHHFSDDDVTRFMDIASCQSADDAREIIVFHLNDTGCRWGLFEKGTGDFLGTCGYHCWRPGADATAEIGYDLGTAYWGQGFMQEALQALISFGFETMHLNRIEAEVEPMNGRSIGLLRKLGFRREPAQRDGLRWFSLLPAAWTTPLMPGVRPP